MQKFSLTFAAAALLAAAGTQAHAANIVLNGGFETGDFTDWTVGNASGDDPWRVATAGFVGNDPFDGTYFASTGCVGSTCITGAPSQQASLSQNLATTVGDTYTLDFWFGSAGNPMELQALFGGTVVEDLLNIGRTPYTEYTISGLVATSPTTQLEFLGRQDPAWDELDDVSVTDTTVAGAPEPASWMLGFGGVLALAGLRRRARP
jgi:MYXO-CTERM domain-containing protein